METRFVVQIKENDNWKHYRKSIRSKAYTLTQEEAVAFMNTLPVDGTYRVVKSVKVNGLINQEVVAGNIS